MSLNPDPQLPHFLAPDAAARGARAAVPAMVPDGMDWVLPRDARPLAIPEPPAFAPRPTGLSGAAAVPVALPLPGIARGWTVGYRAAPAGPRRIFAAPPPRIVAANRPARPELADILPDSPPVPEIRPAAPLPAAPVAAPPPPVPGPAGAYPPDTAANPGPAADATDPAACVPDRPRQPLGEILVADGTLGRADLARALALQGHEQARFGDILLAHGMVTERALYRGLARQYDCAVADLAAQPPDARLVDALGAEICIRLGVLPWKRAGAATVVICSRPDAFAEIRRRLPAGFGRVHLAVAPERDIQQALIAARHRALAGRAETRVAEDESCRNWRQGPTWRYGLAALAAVAAILLAAPVLAFALLTLWAVATLVINSGLKAGAALIYRRHRARNRLNRAADAAAHPAPASLPTVSVLVPLFKEREIAGRLVKRLSAIDYPRELLDICLVVEADDTLTQTTLAATELPAWMRQVTVPGGAVRTKPRALNFALDFCRGTIIGVYDAEDAPEPDQIRKVVRRFANRGPSVACLQGVLDFYNSRENWLARAFAIEYAAWFRIMLPGLERMGLAVPLGGTTLFFRREALEELGGWDAHNVTEDADLGIRLARHGYRTELIDTVTKEEANCRPWPWIRQRSRWIKGYAMTWAVHMRAPRRLRAELGTRKFLGFQFLFLGTLSQFLLAPVLWSFWLLALGLPHPLQSVLPSWAFWGLGLTFFSAELLTIAVGMMAVADAEHRFLIKWVPTLHVYWPLASLAAIKGLYEIAARPFYWDKTQHGHLHRDHDIWGVSAPRHPWWNRA